ncbi:sn-glycerol-3-phosphate transporter [Marinobacter sp.]|uniref:sn-glycerol-3-phosphate transporter n=1 Tax=Marinobacter sp. TaxID=50741 RepID=UPI0025C0B454|nr:sn-glycerol-3-phosphate transporter [Marinobacter sp.]
MLRVLIYLFVALFSQLAQATETRWLLQTSVFTSHHNPKPEHNNDQELVSLEYTRENDWIVGGASFLNSFSQRSAYVYAGKHFDFGPGPVFAKLTGGLMHGYRGEYRDKIPLNHLGVAPAIIPAVGVRGQYVSSELSFLGAAAVMITTGLQF